jgi:hypothetical protein
MRARLRWSRQFRGKDEGAQFSLRLAHPADIGPQATAELARVLQQTVCSVAFEVVPDMLPRIEFWGIRWELLYMQPRMGLADRLDRRPAMNRTAIPEEHHIRRLEWQQLVRLAEGDFTPQFMRLRKSRSSLHAHRPNHHSSHAGRKRSLQSPAT